MSLSQYLGISLHEDLSKTMESARELKMDDVAFRKKLLTQQMGLLQTKITKASAILTSKRLAKLPPQRPETPVVRKPKVELKKIPQGAHATLHVDEERRARYVLKRAARALPKKKKPLEIKKEEPAVIQEPTLFPLRYTRGELPCSIEHRNGAQNGLTWICPVIQLDYEYYLPIFIDGIRSPDEPFKFVARRGTYEMLKEAQGYSHSCIAPCFKEIIKALRRVMQTKDPDNVYAALLVIQHLVMCNYGIGNALVPHYRQLLGVLNYFVTQRPNLRFYFGVNPRKLVDLTSMIFDTLECLERTGGKDAFKHLKSMVPTYQSCFLYDANLPKNLPQPDPSHFYSEAYNNRK